VDSEKWETERGRKQSAGDYREAISYKFSMDIEGKEDGQSTSELRQKKFSRSEKEIIKGEVSELMG